MKKCAQRATALLVAVILLAVAAHAQQAQTLKKEASDSLYRAEGWKLFKQYLQNPNSESGAEAGWQAFLMWANAGAGTDVQHALAQLSDDSELWSYILPYVRGAFDKSDNSNPSDYFSLLVDLENRLTHDASRSAVLFELAQQYQEQGQTGRARQLYQEVVNQDARAFFVDHSLRALHAMESLNIGQPAPEFVAETIMGEQIGLRDFSGNYVLIDFWSTSCAPCMPEIPRLKRLWSAYHGLGLEVIGIAIESTEGKEALGQFVRENDMKWPQVIESWRDGEIVRLYSVMGIPNTYLVGPDGTIVAKHLRGEQLEREIAERLDNN